MNQNSYSQLPAKRIFVLESHIRRGGDVSQELVDVSAKFLKT